MATVEYLHVCDYAFLAQGGKPCIVGIFSTISTAEVPAIHPAMALAIQLQGQPNEHIPVQITISKPDEEVLFRADGQAVASTEGGAFMIATLVALQFPEYGPYTVAVRSDGRVLFTSTITVVPLPPAANR